MLKKFTQKQHSFIVLLAFVALFVTLTTALVGMMWVGALPVGAQGADGASPSWDVPVNLSRSGAVEEPQISVDSAGRYHVLWLDVSRSAFAYTQGDNGVWSTPAKKEMPFGTDKYYPDLKESQAIPMFVPTLLADGEGENIHAFWLDGEESLQYSRVASEQMGDYASWTRRDTLAAHVSRVVAIEDEADTLHVAYLGRGDDEEVTSGIYYIRSTDGGANWSDAIQIFESSYYRALGTDLTTLNITATGGNEGRGGVYIAWDLTPEEKVYFARSADNGETWIPAQLIDSRSELDGLSNDGPSGIEVAASGPDLILMWQAGHEDVPCSPYYQLSSDGGANWGERQLFEVLPNCAADKVFFNHDGLTTALITVNGVIEFETYMVAWDGTRWSNPQIQLAYQSFTNPDTYRKTSFGCQQPVLDGGSLVVVGCDEEDEDVQVERHDAWIRSRPVGSTTDWFPPPSRWSSSVMGNTGGADITPFRLIAGDDGQFHAMWSEEDDAVLSYSRWDGVRWWDAATVGKDKAGPFGRPDIAHVDGLLKAVWTNKSTGELLFSQTAAEEATNSSAWASPLHLPVMRNATASPSIAADPFGTIYVAYAIPVNEDRGIYVVRSEDGGAHWSEPIQVFDAVSAEWEIADVPRLTLSRTGDLHLLWSKSALTTPSEGLGLVYSRSTDGGETWTTPASVTEAPVLWAQTLSSGLSVVHRFWREQSATGLVSLHHEYTTNGGDTWQSPSIIPGTNEADGPAAAIVDLTAQVHMVRIADGELQRWLWNGGDWSRIEDLSLDVAVIGNPTDVEIAINESSQLAVAYTGIVTDEASGISAETLYFTGRNVDAGADELDAFTTPTPTPIPVGTPTATPLPLPTPTIVIPKEDGNTSAIGQLMVGSSIMGALAGVIPAMFIILIVLIIGYRTLRLGRKRR